MKVDGAIMAANPSEAGAAARRLEEVGYDGGFTFEGPHDPFLPLCVAAENTVQLQLATAVAVAFARNPMLLANLGYDLQLQSGGRFILGLGSQIRPHIERRYSAVWSRPAARMRELVLAIRAIWKTWQEGAPLDFRGEFYQHTLMTPVFDPGPNPHGLPPIYLAGIGPRMTEVVGEVADGLFVHPFHTPEFIERNTLPALEAGFARSGRPRESFTICCQTLIAAGSNDGELDKAKNMARAQIAFYGSTPAYRPVLECHGWGDLQSELNRMSKRGQWLEMAGLIGDEILEVIAVVGPVDEIADRIRARCEKFADRVSLVAPFAPDPGRWADVVQALKAR
ncbi:MAG: LLM class F420-dependent oxidoreductase [Myxococcota bacterium]